MRKQLKGIQTILPGTFGADCNVPPASGSFKAELWICFAVGLYSNGTYRGSGVPALQAEIQKKLKATPWKKAMRTEIKGNVQAQIKFIVHLRRTQHVNASTVFFIHYLFSMPRGIRYKGITHSNLTWSLQMLQHLLQTVLQKTLLWNV